MRIERPPRRRNSILLTSLVDVMFVLLFFFMLASSYLDWHEISIDTAGRGTAAPSAGTAWTLQLLPGGQLQLNDQRMAVSELEARLKAAGDSLVVVAAAPGVPLQELIVVIDRIKAAGVKMTLARLPAAP